MIERKKYEYHYCMADTKYSLNDWLNKMGEQGWSLVYTNMSFYIFKREKLNIID